MLHDLERELGAGRQREQWVDTLRVVLRPVFVVAGWLSVRSLARRGQAGFVGSRVLRLGVPLVFFVLLVNPLADYPGNLWDEDDTFLGYLAVTEFSIMWFVVALLVCSLGYAALRSIRPGTDPRPRPGGRSLVVAASVIGVGSLAVWQFTTLLDTHLLNVRVSAWTQAAVLFALGVMAAEARWDGRLPRHTEHRLGQVTVAGVGLTLVLVSYTGARDQLDMALGGLNWASVSFAILYGVVSIAFTLWCLTWLRRRWPTHGPLMTKAGRGSYATYLLHPVVLVSVMLAFRVAPLGAELKFVLVSVSAVPVCFVVGVVNVHQRWHHESAVLSLGTNIDLNGRRTCAARGDCSPRVRRKAAAGRTAVPDAASAHAAMDGMLTVDLSPEGTTCLSLMRTWPQTDLASASLLTPPSTGSHWPAPVAPGPMH